MSCHCGKKLTKKKPFKGRTNLYFCKSCKCIYGLVIIIMSNKCARAIAPSTKISLAEVHKNRKKRRKKSIEVDNEE